MKASKHVTISLFAFALALAFWQGLSASSIEVSQGIPIAATSNYYEREPELLRASSGTWFLVYARSQTIYSPGGNPDGLAYDIYYSASTDNGQTWLECDPSKRMTLPGGNFMPVSITEADGKIWIIAANLVTGDIYYQASGDNGDSWSAPTIILTAVQSLGSFHLNALADGDNIWVFFAGWAETDGIYCIKYDGATDTWGAPAQTLPGPYRMPRVIKDGSVFRMVSTIWANICYSTTTDPSSAVWTTINIPGTETPPGGSSADPAICKDAEGNLWLAYAPWFASDKQRIEYLTSPDNGANWSSSHIFTAAEYGANYWWDFRPYLSEAGTEMLFFAASEKNDPMVNRGVADIVMFRYPKSALGNTHFEFIQSAINAGGSGDIVNIAGGTYPYPLNIDGRSGITLSGAGLATTIFKPASTLSWAIPGYPQYDSRRGSIRVVGSTDIDIKNMNLDFDLIKGNSIAGLLYWNSTGDISDNLIQNMNISDAGGGYYELTGYFRAPGYSDVARANIGIVNNTFLKTGRVGIVTHDYISANIANNVFDKIDDDFGYAIEIGSASTGTILDNTIRNYDTWAATDHSASAGIYIENSFTTGQSLKKPVSVLNNEIHNCQYGIYLGNSAVGYAGDVDIEAFIHGNSIHDNATLAPDPSGGIVVTDEGRDFGSSVKAEIIENSIINNGNHGIYVYTSGNGDIKGGVVDNIIYGQQEGMVIDNFGGGTGSLYALLIYRNTFVNVSNAVDNIMGGFWDNANDTGNCWSDYPTNSGYPGQYNISGTAGAVDRYPNKFCGTSCLCKPGDADNNGITNILDITFIINYLYKQGQSSLYPICGSDANSDCVVNALDVTYLINFLYKHGSKPCDCSIWLSNCGLPLRTGH